MLLCYRSFPDSPSPTKNRPCLPTSPTHMQAMRHATHQKHGNQPMHMMNSTGSSIQSPLSSASSQNCGSPLGQPQMQHHQQNHLLQQDGPSSVIMPMMGQRGTDFNVGIDMPNYCSPTGMHFCPNSFSHTHFRIVHEPLISQIGQLSHGSSSQHNSQSAQSSPNSQIYAQYLTPPSNHSSGAITPQHYVQTLDSSYPTPSPDSPGSHWSSSSPQSNSDWSEGINSPTNNYITGTVGHQTNKGSDAIYI